MTITTPETAPTEPISRTATAAVDRPLLRMRWEALTYVHWAVDPVLVAAQLPVGLTPDTFEGAAYVGLIPFRMAGIGLSPAGVPLPQGTFPETNVRTYVVGPDGGRGVYFHSLDITRAAPTAVARLGYQLPYCFAAMRIGTRGPRVGYYTRRRWPEPRGASSRLIVEVGERLTPDETTPLDDFLSARWSLYAAAPSGAILRALVDHDPWPLRHAAIAVLEDELTAAAGYHLDRAAPDHVRYGGDVDVRVGPPRRVG
ncbi:MAG: DUF2071 domain-containing protein [Nitriliruptoraceae bacterium]|nr:DUF2071 domain-containing protein [Nitriliruptoraceae bacterium]